MSAISESIVREFFEMKGFFVRQQRKFLVPAKDENEEIDLVIINPASETSSRPLPFWPRPGDLKNIRKAIVVVMSSHTEVVNASMLANDPRINRLIGLTEGGRKTNALSETASPDYTRILIVPSLPQNDESRKQISDLLIPKGVHAVLPYSAMLSDLIDYVQPNRNYWKSDVLQMIRILKTYDFLKEKQMELFKPKRKVRAKSSKALPDADEGPEMAL